ncbi:MAG: arginine N-succinyltransferase [Phycisphaeraceae bacterium]
MVVLRPAALNDLKELVALVGRAGFGLTSLPADEGLLRSRIEGSQHGFDKLKAKPEGEPYLFVLEDLTTGKIVGTCGVWSKVGGFEPFYAYRIEQTLHESKMLKVRKEIPTLHLVAEHNGPTEIGSLFLAPEYRGGGNGRLLSVGRFLFMAEFKKFFDTLVIAEMRGILTDQGNSPFWDAIGKHFFEIDLPTADYLSVVNKRFIADLMPKHPIYIPLLPDAAQAVIGKVHAHTEPALHVLETEGFERNEMIDIFEAGPIVECPLRKIRAVKESVRKEIAAIVDGPLESPSYIVSNTSRDFRACLGMLLEESDDRVTITKVMGLGLKVKVGDRVRYVTAKAGK